MRTTSRNTGERGQTTLDFAIAMGLFLLTVSFTFMFIPSLTAPFVSANQDGSVAADRVASHLAMGALGDPDEPYVVDQDCATPFFEDAEMSQVPASCGYAGSSFKERVGLDDRRGLRIEMLHVDPSRSGESRFRQVCVDSDGNVTHEETGSCQVDYSIGDEPTSDSSVTVAHRVVTVPDCEFGTDPYGSSIESCDVTVRVIVW